jgi:D-amino-acid oxidase
MPSTSSAGVSACRIAGTPPRIQTCPKRILQRCRRAEPRLRDAQIIEVVTGPRPDRPKVRVETETVAGTRYVHNYGHGGNGVSLSWGCAREAAHLATG